MEFRKCALVGLMVNQTKLQFDTSMREMEALAEAAGLEVQAVFTQSLPKVNTGWYIGSGKISEIRAYLEMNEECTLVLFDQQLSPMQLRNLSNSLRAEVLDRTALILKIFAERARTREAVLQVESARLQYLLPRLAGMHDDLGRQGGTSGAMSNRGAGEKQIELDRRHIEQRMAQLRKELEEVERERRTQRKARMRSPLARVSLVGYTNAGKSTILNGMLRAYGSGEEKQVFEKDMLFATLDTSVRRIEPDGRMPFLLSDTVGFINHLPTPLITAFRSTLEESGYADLLLLVADISDPDFRDQLAVTIRTLQEIGAGSVPRLFVFNKADCLPEFRSDAVSVPGLGPDDSRVTISAKSGAGIEKLLLAVEAKINSLRTECELLIPYAKGQVLSALMERTTVEILEYTEKGTRVRALLGKQDAKMCKEMML